ncbi:hypothetical protein ACFQ1S_20500 [Kibdelosporangium lantanae]|uniref:Uncharacterized protein n=1 Tax=Kibdelosporangium lantanae TaxID=1497396 RepID=A0ABW3MAF7_9PSEU
MCRNPFQGIIVRAVEVVHAVDEAIHLLDGHQPPEPSFVDIPARDAVGHGATEAPRASCTTATNSRTDWSGPPTSCHPPPRTRRPSKPTSPNWSLRTCIWATRELTALCEQAIRNYDPCISCAVHFLDLTVEHR